MTLRLCPTRRRQHETHDDAARAIEIFYPAGYFYEIVEVRISCREEITWAVKVYGQDCGFLGYAYDAEEEGPL